MMCNTGIDTDKYTVYLSGVHNLPNVALDYWGLNNYTGDWFHEYGKVMAEYNGFDPPGPAWEKRYTFLVDSCPSGTDPEGYQL